MPECKFGHRLSGDGTCSTCKRHKKFRDTYPPDHPRLKARSSKPLTLRQLRPTLVYVIGAASGGPVKIGHSRSPEDRLRTIQTGCPWPVSILASAPGGAAAERRLHDRFANYRIGEWFDLPSYLRDEIIADLLDTELDTDA
jgi:hypothetical protein